MHSISSSLEFLRFPLLTLHAKLRLAWTMYYGSRIDDWRRLERISVTDWLTRISGRQAYEKFWQPLLLAKLGRNYERVSAVFIWSYIKRLFSARDGSAGKEQLGHVRGGYKSVFERIQQRIAGGGGRVVSGAEVAAVEPSAGRGLCVRVGGELQQFDKVVCTSPVSVLRRARARIPVARRARGRRRIPRRALRRRRQQRTDPAVLRRQHRRRARAVHGHHRHEQRGRAEEHGRPLSHLPAEVHAVHGSRSRARRRRRAERVLGRPATHVPGVRSRDDRERARQPRANVSSRCRC